MRSLRVVGLVVVVVLAAPAVASAASTEYASPTGTGSLCTATQECTLRTALTLAAAPGDTVRLRTGTYPIEASLITATSGVHVIGEGQRPLVSFSSGGLVLQSSSSSGSTSSITNVEVRTASGSAIRNSDATGTMDRVIGRSTAGAGCFVGSVDTGAGAQFGTISNSLCVSGGGLGYGLALRSAVTGASPTVQNVTAIGSAYGLYLNANPGTMAAEVHNSIVRGGTTDVQLEGSSTNFVSLFHSNYATTFPAARVGDSGGRQTGAPAFVNPAAGDYHQDFSSVTINGGEPGGGALDLDGNSRTLGGATDIGAYEFVSPSAATLAATAVTDSAAVLNGSVDPQGQSGTARFEYGPTTAYGTLTTVGTVAGSGARAVSAPIGGLSPNTTYHYRLVYAVGPVVFQGADLSFTTAAPGVGGGGGGGPGPGPGPVGDTTPPVLSALAVSPKRFAVAAGLTATVARATPKGAKVRYSLSEAARVFLKIERTTTGHRSGKRCVAGKGRRGARPCTRYASVATLVRASRAGATTIALTGRIGTRRTAKRLATGTYRLTATATDGAGNRSATPQTASFTVAKR